VTRKKLTATAMSCGEGKNTLSGSERGSENKRPKDTSQRLPREERKKKGRLCTKIGRREVKIKKPPVDLSK